MGFRGKCHFQCAFDDNVGAIHVFIKKIFRAGDKATSPPPPPTVFSVRWDRLGSFCSTTVSLVMVMRQWGFVTPLFAKK
jgi:hypothetical protein